jgi:hypothetical protein
MHTLRSTIFILALLQSGTLAADSFVQWREKLDVGWKSKNIQSFSKKADYLRFTIDYYRPIIEINGSLLPLPQNNLNWIASQEVEYSYNRLRELLRKPKVKSYSEIDWKWFDEVKLAIEYTRSADIYDWDPATLAQTELVHEAQRIIGLEPKLRVFSDSGASSTAIDIVVCAHPDLDSRLFGIYHELGHVTHKDHKKIKGDQAEVDAILKDIGFAEDLKEIDNFLSMARKNLPQETKLGRKFQEDLQENKDLWIPPTAKADYGKMLVLRGMERRADLFAAKKLFAQGKISTLLAEIRHYGLSNYVTAKGTNTHPSHVERSLYLLGFLMSQKSNVADLLLEYEGNGKCARSETLSNKQKTNSGFYEFIKQYQRWQQSLQAYHLWKEVKLNELLKGETTPSEELKSEFAMEIIDKLKDKSSQSIKTKNELWYKYNFLRESAQKPIVLNFNLIDPNWIYDYSFNLWRTGLLETEKLAGITDKKVIDSIRIKLQIRIEWLDKNDCSGYCTTTLLHYYNFVRDHFKKSQARSIKHLDRKWISSLEE